MQPTLHNANLNPHIHVSHYDRKKLKPRIVHLGFGAFHRAHQAFILEKLLNQDQTCDWGYCEVNIIGGEQLIKDLRAQDCLYSVMEMEADKDTITVVGCVCDTIHPELDGMDKLLDSLSAPETAIISMTITEKGYCLNINTHTLDTENPLIKHDLKNPTQPQSALGVIVEGLARRKAKGTKGLTVLSCDNLPQNGVLTHKMVIAFANARDTELAQWIEQHVTFPSTMVDRIVPAITEQSATKINESLGVVDPCGIACEPFLQWVIEDHFVAGRPAWEKVGVQMVDNVLPFEEMKLRMLNGSHSFLAYLGYLGGYETIAQTMTSDIYRHAAYYLMLKEQASTLTLPQGVDAQDYAKKLIERFTNPSLQHRTWQIAMDGSQKLPQRLLEGIEIHVKRGTDYRCAALAIAAWMIYVSAKDLQGKSIDVRDPLADKLKAICDHHGHHVSVVKALINESGVFPMTLVKNMTFIKAIEHAYQQIMTLGVEKAIIDLKLS